jgi:hypothetical protein
MHGPNNIKNEYYKRRTKMVDSNIAGTHDLKAP